VAPLGRASLWLALARFRARISLRALRAGQRRAETRSATMRGRSSWRLLQFNVPAPRHTGQPSSRHKHWCRQKASSIHGCIRTVFPHMPLPPRLGHADGAFAEHLLITPTAFWPLPPFRGAFPYLRLGSFGALRTFAFCRLGRLPHATLHCLEVPFFYRLTPTHHHTRTYHYLHSLPQCTGTYF